MTEQEILDTVWAHLRKQGSQAMDVGQGNCVYRHADGRACAVGCLVNDAQAREMDEIGGGVDDVKAILPDELIPHLDFLHRLQMIHDSAKSWTKVLPEQMPWMQKVEILMNDLAVEKGLTPLPK